MNSNIAVSYSGHAVIKDTEASGSALEIALLLGQLSRAEATRMLLRRSKELGAHEQRLKRLYGHAESRSGPAKLANAHAVSRPQGEAHFVRDILGWSKTADGTRSGFKARS